MKILSKNLYQKRKTKHWWISYEEKISYNSFIDLWKTYFPKFNSKNFKFDKFLFVTERYRYNNSNIIIIEVSF